MSKHTLSTLAAACALCATFVLTSGCDFTEARNSFDDLDAIIQLEPVNTFAVGQVIDAGTGELITSSVQITFDGPDKSALVDAYSDPLTEATADKGFFSFGVRNELVPSENDPVEVVVNATAPGYYPASKSVKIRETGGDHAVALYLLPVDPDQQPAGASQNAAVVGNTDADGTLAQAATVSTSTGAGGQASLTLPAGIQFTDESGNPIQGTVTARLIHYDVSSPELLLALQGLSTASSAGKNGSEEDVMYKYQQLLDAGVLVDGDDGTNYGSGVNSEQAARLLAKIFEQDIQVNFPTSTFTDVPTDNWYAGYVDVARRQIDTTGIHFDVNQDEAKLYARRLGLIAILQKMQTVMDGLQIQMSGTNGPVNVLISGEGWAQQYITAAIQNGLLTLHDVPIGEPATITLLSGGIAQTLHVSDVSTGSQTVDLSGGSDATDVTFDLQMDYTVKLKPPFNATLTYREAGSSGPYQSVGKPTWTTDELGRVSGGSLTIPNLITGATYHFVLYVPEANETHTQDITITGSTMAYHADIPSDLCVR